MSWLRSAGWVGLILLSGCGFSPMYGNHRDSAGLLAAGVRVSAGDGPYSHQFQADLEDLLNPGQILAKQPSYNLQVTMTLSEGAIAVAPDGTIQRYTVNVYSTYTLTRLQNGKPVDQGTVSKVTSYNNAPNAYFSTFVSKEDALKRAVKALAEDYRLRMAGFFAQYPDGNQPNLPGIVQAPAATPVIPSSSDQPTFLPTLQHHEISP